MNLEYRGFTCDKRILFLLGSLIIIVFSCVDKDDVLPETPEVNYASAIKLKIGNYWIYDSRSLVLNSDTVLYNYDDSTFIARDTIVNKEVYSVLENEYGLFELLRDSLGYIVNERNKIMFSSSNFSDTLYKENKEFALMHKKEESISVPAGDFTTALFIVLTEEHHHNYHHSHDDPTVYEHDHRYRILSKTWYAKEVGVVKSVFYYGNIIAYERSLKRFRVK